MLLNLILFFIVLGAIILLYLQLRKPYIAEKFILPECKFTITNPEYEISDNVRIAKYSVYTKNKNRYFRDFPIGFRFYSNEKFKSKIKITYNVANDEEIEVIYDKMVEFEDHIKEHIYYVNDVIVGSIDIEIYTDSVYGKPTIGFEILQNNMCHMTKEYKLEIKFPR
jgi:hypothetical protein